MERRVELVYPESRLRSRVIIQEVGNCVCAQF